MPFDYEEAELDILENGGDPDFLSYSDPIKRDNYLRKMGLNPESYGGGMKDPEVRKILSAQAEHSQRSVSSGSDLLGSLAVYGFIAVAVIVSIPFIVALYILKLFVDIGIMIWEALTELPAALHAMIVILPISAVLLMLARYLNPAGFQKASKQILLILGAPFRLAYRWFQKDRLAALSCLAGVLIGLALISAWFFYTFF